MHTQAHTHLLAIHAHCAKAFVNCFAPAAGPNLIYEHVVIYAEISQRNQCDWIWVRGRGTDWMAQQGMGPFCCA